MSAAPGATARRRARRGVFLALALCCLAPCLALRPGAAVACTLWAAAPDRTDGGALLAKNRDNDPSQTDSLALVAPERANPYLGLFADIDGRATLVAGINRAGLALVSATAGSVPRELRKVASRPKGLAAKVLAECASVDQALAHGDWFAGHAPVVYMLADARRIAWVEVGPGGKTAVRAVDRGTLAHTNHYLPGGLDGENRGVGRSSLTRYERVRTLLDQARAPLTLDAFAAMSRDRDAGPDDSIFRTGSTPQKTRTLATFLVRLPASGPARALVAVFDSGAFPATVDLTLDDAFWNRVAPGGVLPVYPAEEARANTAR